jgi:hypothetical protein
VQEQVDSLFGWKPENVIEWLFTNPNGPGREEQEESLLICLEGAEGPESAAAAVLDQIYSRQQAGNPALQPAASELHDEPGPCVIMTSEHDPVVLGVDLDGVCADFYGRMREVASEWFERPLDELTQNVTYGLKEWGVDTLEQYNSLHRFAVTSRDLFRTVCCDDFPMRDIVFASLRIDSLFIVSMRWRFNKRSNGLITVAPHIAISVL